jgi:hypothetical protein
MPMRERRTTYKSQVVTTLFITQGSWTFVFTLLA